MPGVTISSAYGAGGSVVAPAVAETLRFELIDRAINSQVARALEVTVEEAQAGTVRRDFVERFFGVLAPMAAMAVAPDRPVSVHDVHPLHEPVLFRAETERLIGEAVSRGAVVLGRAGAAALQEAPDVLRVRLFGPAEARVRQGAQVEGVDEDEARERLTRVDRARAQYVQRLYGRDIDDPQLYHLQLDSTALALDDCAQVIADAYRRFAARTANRSVQPAQH